MAEICTDTTDAADYVVDLGNASEDAARWWIALLSSGQGWKAIVSRDSDRFHLSPWSVEVDYETNSKVGVKTMQSHTALSKSTPPSSLQALEYLVEFCTLHDTHSQLFAALAVALTLPTHNQYRISPSLPLLGGRHAFGELAISSNIPELYDDLPYYMAMSCHCRAVISSLCGVFWQQDVPCNLVSPWLHPILNEIPDLSSDPSFPAQNVLLAIICAIRCPPLAPLWFGATLSGLSSLIINLAGNGTPPLNPDASAWTGCPQSFMDMPGSGSYYIQTSSDNKIISRADVWRLLYLPPVVEDGLYYNSPPFSPWYPAGTTTIQNSVIRVQVHQDCPRHQLLYQHWAWHIQHGSALEDSGYRSSSKAGNFHEIKPPLTIDADHQARPLSDQNASENASRMAFAWVSSNGEGHPPEAVYLDPWIRDDSSDGQESLHSSGSLDSKIDKDKSTDTSAYIQEWINQVDAGTAIGAE
ncbi:hypothetical protein FQN49_003464 [Arthroderma sp. PD_2]|nr:hypothetical protein FQN49_003464 [Arthroderma sp. PD_2]